MCRRVCLWAVTMSLVGCAAVSAPPRCQAQPLPAILVSNTRDEWKPEPRLTGEAARKAEQAAAAKLSSFKNAQGRAKYLVISERLDPDSPEKQVTSINYMGAKLDDEALKLTARLFRIGTIIADSSNIRDEQLRYFSGLKSLTSLVLNNTAVGDKGMVHLRRLSKLQTLHLAGTKVSDRGLDDIARLSDLKILNLSKTKVTSAGMKKLLPLNRLAWLLLSDTKMNDAGLMQLAKMKDLHRLTVTGTKVTAAGIDRLKRAIPKLSVDH
jgi:hypothetical protein